MKAQGKQREYLLKRVRYYERMNTHNPFNNSQLFEQYKAFELAYNTFGTQEEFFISQLVDKIESLPKNIHILAIVVIEKEVDSDFLKKVPEVASAVALIRQFWFIVKWRFYVPKI